MGTVNVGIQKFVGLCRIVLVDENVNCCISCISSVHGDFFFLTSRVFFRSLPS